MDAMDRDTSRDPWAGTPGPPMEARLSEHLPTGAGWQYEPKWDGFRALAIVRRETVSLLSKSGKPLGRYFPDILALLEAVGERDFVVDGELVIPVDGRLSFGALQARLHPAASRVARLVAKAPAQFILFDCLEADGVSLSGAPLHARRMSLVGLHGRMASPDLILSPATADAEIASGWLRDSGGALDGIVAKQLDEPYHPGERAVIKVKQLRTADCVVGGYRENDQGEVVSLLLGLYGQAGTLDHVGFTSSFGSAQKNALKQMLRPYEGGDGFTGDRPGGPSRWNGGQAKPWIALRPELVAEVIYDQITDGRFRHGTRFHRWRPDKSPRHCGRDQLVRELPPRELVDLITEGGRRRALTAVADHLSS